MLCFPLLWRSHGFSNNQLHVNSEAGFVERPMETVLGRTLFVQMEGAVLTSLCCGLDELIQRTRASQHCTDFYLRGWRRLNYELKCYVAVAAASSWVSEGVLNNNVDDDRLLRNTLTTESRSCRTCVSLNTFHNSSGQGWPRWLEERPRQAC